MCFEIVQIDRGKHAYKIQIDDLGEPISIAFGDPSVICAVRADGFLTCRVTPLPEGTPSVAFRREQERRQQEERKEAEAEAERVSAAVAKLSVRARTFHNWSDAE